MNNISIFFFVSLSLTILVAGCKKSSKAPKTKTSKSQPMRKAHQPMRKPFKGKIPKEPKAKVAQLGPKDELTCKSICSQLGYCQAKTTMRPTSQRRQNTCIARCKGEKSPTGKAINKIIRSCVDKNRGDNCQALKTCLNNGIQKTRKRFLSMHAMR